MVGPEKTQKEHQLAGLVVYMLYGDDGEDAGGPFLGEPDLDLSSLASEFRTSWYAGHEARGEDFCFLNHGDFISWLLERKTLLPMGSASLYVGIDTSGENAYVPHHWPLCPECGEGRGRPETGQVLYSLNRQEHFRQCTACHHIWDRHHEQWLSKAPMLDDDGRYTPSGCVPYSISQACGLPFSQVVEACRRRGWSEKEGIAEDQGIEVAGEFGHRMVAGYIRMIEGKLTLRKVLAALSPAKTYIVATRGHWLSVVNGQNRDQADTSLRTEVVGYWEVLPGQKA